MHVVVEATYVHFISLNQHNHLCKVCFVSGLCSTVSEKRYKSCHWGCTLLYLKGAYW